MTAVVPFLIAGVDMRRRMRRRDDATGCRCAGGPWCLETPVLRGNRIVAWRVDTAPECWHRARARVGLGDDTSEPYAGYWCTSTGVRVTSTGAPTVEHAGARYVLEPGVTLRALIAAIGGGDAV